MNADKPYYVISFGGYWAVVKDTPDCRWYEFFGTRFRSQSAAIRAAGWRNVKHQTTAKGK